ncbi:MAG TPA: AAA family ATPase, partial [Candidatus Competibacter sp.]|nr:AAA family ATPase [Candidatus Competibacter sp.]
PSPNTRKPQCLSICEHSPLNLDLNRQFNAIIGGRGTGKSSILEYLRWALCDESVPSYDDESIDYQVKRKN